MVLPAGFLQYVKVRNYHQLEENGCLLVIGSVERLYYPKEIQEADCFLRIGRTDTIMAMGMDGYALPTFLDRMSYARPDSESNVLSDET